MNSDERFQKQIEQYQELAKENKNIDVSSLVLNSLETKTDANKVSKKQKHWAYVVSLGLPPFGLLFAAYFYIGDKEDGREVAIMCVILTVFSLVLTYVFFKIILSSSGTSFNQIEQINPQMIQQTLQ